MGFLTGKMVGVSPCLQQQSLDHWVERCKLQWAVLWRHLATNTKDRTGQDRIISVDVTPHDRFFAPFPSVRVKKQTGGGGQYEQMGRVMKQNLC